MNETTVLVVILFDLYVVYQVFKSQLLDRSQKLIQSAIVLLLPFVGAVGVLLYVRHLEREEKDANSGEKENNGTQGSDNSASTS